MAELVVIITTAIIASITALIEGVHIYVQYNKHEADPQYSTHLFAPVMSSCCNGENAN